jgi:ferritin-like metal-binding protein YciE
VTKDELKDVFVDQIRDLYDAEKQIVKALPKLAKAAQSEDLVEGLRNHLEQTQEQVQRLERVFESLEVPAKGKPCKGMRGLLEEGSEVLKEEDKGEMRDLAIIAACQRVEHYEISAYGTTRTLAEKLGMEDAVELLEQTEQEEEAADETLTEAAASIYESMTDEEADEGEEAEEEKTLSAGASSRGASRRTKAR